MALFTTIPTSMMMAIMLKMLIDVCVRNSANATPTTPSGSVIMIVTGCT